MHQNAVVELFMILHALRTTVVVSVIFCIDFMAINTRPPLCIFYEVSGMSY